MHAALSNTIQELEQVRDTSGNPYWNIDATTAQLLQSLIIEHTCTKALELGTSNGLSSLYLAVALEQTGGTLTTVESHAERFALASQHFKQAMVTDMVMQVKGHAPEVLDEIPGMFDFLFIDATSIEYELYYTHLKSRILPGGIIVADNVLSHKEKVQGFVDSICQDSQFATEIKSIGKGLLLAKRLA